MQRFSSIAERYTNYKKMPPVLAELHIEEMQQHLLPTMFCYTLLHFWSRSWSCDRSFGMITSAHGISVSARAWTDRITYICSYITIHGTNFHTRTLSWHFEDCKCCYVAKTRHRITTIIRKTRSRLTKRHSNHLAKTNDRTAQPCASPCLSPADAQKVRRKEE